MQRMSILSPKPILSSALYIVLGALLPASTLLAEDSPPPRNSGVLPVGDDGKALNLDFEAGNLRDWTATGNAFSGQPIKGDTVVRRRPDMVSNHAGEHWIGTFEVSEDGPRGTLTSKPFTVTHPWASFLIGGGSTDESVDIVLADDHKLFFHATGDNRESMEPVAVDLSSIMGKRIYLRVVDDHSFGWGHINFDDFRFHKDDPQIPKRVMLTEDIVPNAGLTPEQAVKAMTLPQGFSATLFAGEPDVHQPVGFCIDDRGRLWVAEAHTYPRRAPEGEGKDSIIIFEDTDGDGKHDKRTVFTTGLNLVSGIEVGFGGVWVGAAPYLLFIPDQNGDDKPDSEPKVLLDGWAYHDTHETLNAFNWGPDGWLYGCHGVFTHSRVGKPGTPDEQRIPINAGVWRYHPSKHIFEVFAEGSSNPWGVDFNDRGQAFITACVIPHLYHVIQGGRYQRQAGQHFSPYVYQDIQNIGDHVHWLGEGGPHAGNNKSGAAGGGHAHCGAMVYLGGSWPEQYRNSIFMANIHGNRLNNDQLVATGSGYVGTHAPDPILMNDKWSRLINAKYGPDGSVYIVDWYDKQACHNPINEIWDRTNGRIYKIIYDSQPGVQVDLTKMTDEQLVELQLHENDWYVRHARRLLQEREARGVAPALRKVLQDSDVTRRLRAMWALHAIGELSSSDIDALSRDLDPYVRGWTIQLMMENAGPVQLTGPFAEPAPCGDAQQHGWQLQHLLTAASDRSPIVRLYVASALQRLQYEDRWPILTKLVSNSEDAGDHNLPVMYWYAAEPAVGDDYQRGIELARASQVPLIRELIARRIAAIATRDAKGDASKIDLQPINALSDLLNETDDAALAHDVFIGLTDSLRGWPALPAPKGWSEVYVKYSKSTDDDLVARLRAISVTFGEERALAALRQTIMLESANLADRRSAIDALVAAKDEKVVPLLQELIADPTLRANAIRGLAAFDDPKTPQLLLNAYSTLDTATRVDALNTLAARPEYAQHLMNAIQAGHLKKEEVTAATLRQLASLESSDIQRWLAETYGSVRSTPEEKLHEIARWEERLRRKNWADAADPMAGRAIFAKTCVQCHTLFDVGGKVGPDLTGSNRADLGYVLSNIIDPSAVISKDYMVTVVKLKDNRVLSGIAKKDDGNVVTLQTEAEVLDLPKSSIVIQKQQNISMMPEGLLAGLKNEQVRDLVAYLGSARQVPMMATADNLAGFFNGKTLDGWSGNPQLWRVENGEIIGKSDGLKKNEFLFSNLAAADFRLTLKVKLIDNKGNSGIQFRSELIDEGQARGYQADIGAGWWGKLYEEHGRELLWPESGERYVKEGEWNTYEIVAVGQKILTAINGNACVELNDPDGARKGIFALQLHSGGPMEVRFKDLVLELNPEAKLKTLKK